MTSSYLLCALDTLLPFPWLLLCHPPIHPPTRVTHFPCRRATHLLNLLFLRVFGAAPDSPDSKGPLFGEEQLDGTQRSLLDGLCAETRMDTKGILRSLAVPEVPTVPQRRTGGCTCQHSCL